MRYLYWGLGLVLALMLLALGLQTLASERVEVVELFTEDDAGAPATTRLWVVDDEGFAYLRVGSGTSGWSGRLLSQPSFELSRNGRRASYTAVIREDKRDRINQLMQEKYGWGDSLIGVMVGNRNAAVPLELRPL